MASKCPDCGDKRIAFSTRKPIARIFHPILPFRAGRCGNCKRRRTSVNGLSLLVCFAGPLLILTYFSEMVSGLQIAWRKVGFSAAAHESKPRTSPSKVVHNGKANVLSEVTKNGSLKGDIATSFTGPPLEKESPEGHDQKMSQSGQGLEALRYSNKTLDRYLAQQKKIIAAKERQIDELSNRLSQLEQAATTESPRAQATHTVARAEEAIVIRDIEQWRVAWQSQDVPAYISRYTSDFRPSNGLSHDAWLKDREGKVVRPKMISVQIRDLRIQRLDDNRWRAIFEQTYRSNTYRDVVMKELILVKVNGRYLIAKEQIAS